MCNLRMTWKACCCCQLQQPFLSGPAAVPVNQFCAPLLLLLLPGPAAHLACVEHDAGHIVGVTPQACRPPRPCSLHSSNARAVHACVPWLKQPPEQAQLTLGRAEAPQVRRQEGHLPSSVAIIPATY